MQTNTSENILDAIKIALVVGTILTAINQYDVILTGHLAGKDILRMGFNYLVPFSVASISRILYIRKQKERSK